MKSVLFVCIENSCRSQLAEAFADMHGSGAVEAYSGGSKPSGIVNPKAIDTMKELSYDLSTHQSKSLDEISDIEYDTVVTMGCGDVCPAIKARLREDWQIPDPKNMDVDAFREIRNLIEEKVLMLIRRLQQP